MYVGSFLPSSCLTLTAQTLTVFLGGVLSKRYTNPSAEIITILAGLDEVDHVLLEFAGAVENAIRLGGSGASCHAMTNKQSTDYVSTEIRRKAVTVAIALTAGAYQTSLVSYFTHRDLFPALIKVRFLYPMSGLRDIFAPYCISGVSTLNHSMSNSSVNRVPDLK